MAKKRQRRKLSPYFLSGLASSLFFYYTLTSVVADLAWYQSEELGWALTLLSAVFALIFIVLTFVTAIVERDVPTLLLFALIMFVVVVVIF